MATDMFEYADESQKNLHKKMPNAHFLSNPKNVDHALLWNTFFRKNIHRFAMDYLGLKLHWYQIIILYFMGISQMFVVIASRAASKSFVIAIYACCRCITRPYTKVVIASATKKQARLIITEKIQKELMSWSPMLKKEVADIKTGANEIELVFKNNSSIIVCVAGDNARGLRSTCLIREEFRMIDKTTDDTVLSPMQFVRPAPFLLQSEYINMPELKEEPIDIYISSSWYDNGHWMWKLVDDTFDNMLKDSSNTLLAFDESIILKSGIKTVKQLEAEKKKQDPVSWRMEFLNERILENASAFFTYKMLIENQNLKQVFYPRTSSDFKANKKNKYLIPKLDGEIRVVSNDIAFVAGSKNDNSVYSCIRAIPESITYETDDNNIEVKQGYKRQYSYIESNQIGDTTLQAIRIRQLYEDFNADYIVLDVRNGGELVALSYGNV